MDRMEIAGRVGIEESGGATSRQDAAEEIVLLQNLGDWGIGFRPVVAADRSGHVAAGEDRRLTAGRLRRAIDPQARIEGEKRRPSPLERRGRTRQPAPLEQRGQRRHARADEGISNRVLVAQPHAVEKEDEEPRHQALRSSVAQAEGRRRSVPGTYSRTMKASAKRAARDASLSHAEPAPGSGSVNP